MQSLIKSFKLSSSIVLIAVLLFLVVPTHAEGTSRIAFVSSERILREANLVKYAQAKIKAEFSKRNKWLQSQAKRVKSVEESLYNDLEKLSKLEKTRRQKEIERLKENLQLARREFREALNKRSNEELATILEISTKVIKRIAEDRKYDIVFQEGGVYISPRIDITDSVLSILNK